MLLEGLGPPSHPNLLAGLGKEGTLCLLDSTNTGKYNPSSLTQGDYLPGRDLVCQPRQCYLAFQTLARTLGPYHFERQLTARGGDYALEFRDGDGTRVAAWTEGSPHAAPFPTHGLSLAIGITGQALPDPAPSSQGILLTLTQSARYLVP